MEEWWRGGVIYQIYPRSFQDTNSDGIGDLKGITKRLEYIAELGVDAVWISPIFSSPMKDMGYDVSDYKNIDPIFGTLEDFDELVDRAHSLDLKVMIDQVLSHSSDQHPFFLESREGKNNPKSDWYVWSDPLSNGSAPNNWLSIFEGVAWEWEARRKQYYLHNFLVCQPDFNFHNKEVQDWLLSTVRFWLDRGVDGFRLDTVNYYFHDKKLRDNPARLQSVESVLVNPYYMQEHIHSISQPENITFIENLRVLVDQYEDCALIGEISNIDLMAEYTKGNKRLQLAYSFELLGTEFSSKHIKDVIEYFFEISPNGNPCWSFSNHDVIRHLSRWSEEQDSLTGFAKLTAAILLSLEGTICLFQGEELGQTESDLDFEELTDPLGKRFWPENKGRDGCRTPMVWNSEKEYAGFSDVKPWLPVKDSQLKRASYQQLSDPESVLSFYKLMLSFRKNNKELRNGKTTFIDIHEQILAFSRKFDEKIILCVFNLAKDSIKLKAEGVECANSQITCGVKFSNNLLKFEPNGFIFLRANSGNTIFKVVN
ncbi:MAG: alpha-glucosidase [Rhodobiaceae bacterium]|nr:alpha-glucosidase [Rhodobiaceae bacterium]